MNQEEKGENRGSETRKEKKGRHKAHSESTMNSSFESKLKEENEVF